MHNDRFLRNRWHCLLRLLSIRCVPVPIRLSVAPTIVVNFARDPHLVESAYESVGAVRLSFRLLCNRLCLRLLLPRESIQQLSFQLEAVDAELARGVQSRQFGMESPELVAL